MSRSFDFEEMWVTADGGTTTEPVNPNPPPEGTAVGPYRVTANFNADTYYGVNSEALKYRTALLSGYPNNLNPVVDKLFGDPTHFPNHISLSALRAPKRYANLMRIFIALTGDPAFLPPIYDFLKPIADYLNSPIAFNWAKWPSGIPLPGAADSNGIVTDTYSLDFNQKRWNGETGSLDNGGSRDIKAAYERWDAWGKASTSRYSPNARANLGKEYTQYKKILYLNMKGQDTVLYDWGTHFNELDGLLGHAWLAWSAYMLDLHRDLDTRYGPVADTLYDYFFNHWTKLIQLSPMNATRSSTRGIYKIRKALYHSVSAHASLYGAFVAWKSLPNTDGRTGRPAAPDPEDVLAAKSIMSPMFQQFGVYNCPAGIPGIFNSQNYEFVNHSHDNRFYRAMAEMPSSSSGAADSTYDSEFGSEVMWLYVSGAADANGRKFTRADIARLSMTLGQVLEKKQTSSTFDPQIAENVAAARNGTTKYTRFKHYSSTNTSQRVETMFGGTDPYYTTGSNGFAQYAMTGGWYHWADPTPERLNQHSWLLRARYNQSAGQRITPAEILADPAGPFRSRWMAIGCFLLCKLLTPEQSLADINTNGYTV